MPYPQPTIESFITQRRQKETFWMVFNTRYNEIHALNQKPDDMDSAGFYDPMFTNKEARASFLTFMKTTFPQVILIEVMDHVSTGWFQWPYLGSIAIDADVESEVFRAIDERYGRTPTPEAMVWKMSYEEAKTWHTKRTTFIASFEDEMGED